MQQLSQPGSCCEQACDEVVNVSVPGPQGAAGTNGTNGTDGADAYTELTATFEQPAVNATVVAEVLNSAIAAIGVDVFVETGGYYLVTAIPDATHITIKNLGYTANAPVTTVIPIGARVRVAGPIGDAGGVTAGALLAVNDLNDVADVPTARSNLGLGLLAVRDTVGTAQIDDLSVTVGKLPVVLDLSGKTLTFPGTSAPFVEGQILQANLDQHLNDLLPQAMAVFTGGTGARPFAANYNIPIGGITQVSTGIYDVVFANAVPFGTLHITFGLGTTLGTPNVLYRAGYSGVGVNGFRIHVFDGANAAADPPSLSFIVHSVLNP